MNWDEYFMTLAEVSARKSKDPSTKVGAVIVGPNKEVRCTGFNGYPRGVRDDHEGVHTREQRLARTCHAEANAIIAAARVGTPTNGCIIYATAFPCAECAKAIIQAGICEVVAPPTPPSFRERWKESIEVATSMFNEAGVTVRIFDGRVNV